MRGDAILAGPTEDQERPHRPTPDELADEVWEDESPAAVPHADAQDARQAHALRNLYPRSVATRGDVAHG